MPRLWLALVFVLPATAFAQATPLDMYRDLAGAWSSDDQSIEISYTVEGGVVRITGEICSPATAGPRTCVPINQDYEPAAAGLTRENTQYGQQNVEILELTNNRLVKKEAHPLDRNVVAITTEERAGEDLNFTSETWVAGHNTPESHVQARLHRRPQNF